MTATYRAASAESKFCLIACSHDHLTVYSAAACISCAGGYVVAVEGGVLRALSDGEEAEFQKAMTGQKFRSSLQAEYGYLFRTGRGSVKPT